MKTINTKQILVNFKGEPLKDGETELTVGLVVSMVLGGKVSNPTLGWDLGNKFAKNDGVELKAEDVVFLKKELEASHFNAIVTGQIVEILESK